MRVYDKVLTVVFAVIGVLASAEAIALMTRL